MDEPTAFAWSYDRNPWDSRDEATTFSVGLYQWLPAKSGKLKKSKTIRVLGYVAEADAVYAKADELCAKFNAAGVRAEAPPDWVQKQYSLPRPPGVTKSVRPNQISADEARKIRDRAAREWLRPVGFEQTHASTHVRRVGDILQLINFQTDRWGGSFTVNLGLHYVFTPPLFSMQHMRWTELEELDCSLRGRVGQFMPQKLDTWHEFGPDAETFRGHCQEFINASLTALDTYSETLRDPQAFLTASPPDVRPFHISYPLVFQASIAVWLDRLDEAERLIPAGSSGPHSVTGLTNQAMLDLINDLRSPGADPRRKRWLI